MLAAMVAMSSCDNATFKVDASIEGMGNQNVHIVFLGDSGVSDAFILVTDGKFKIKGDSHQWTIVGILDSQNKPLCRFAVKGGQTVTLTGDMGKPHFYTVKGNGDAAAWMDFERENAALYDNPDRKPLDDAIAKYVKQNPGSIVSTLLLIADYSDINSPQAHKLLQSIDPDARPESLVSSMQRMQALVDKPETRLHTMMLCGTSGDFEALVPASTGATLIYWWIDVDQKRRQDIAALRRIKDQYGSALSVADVTLRSDTAGWHSVVAGDSAHWQHYWSPGSILDPAVMNLKLRQLPLCIVADSTGKQIYRGNDITDAASVLNRYFGK